MKIGIYGGSFNPPHLGHEKLAKELAKKTNLDSLLIIPSNISPQKQDNGNIEPYHRLNMCRLTFTDSLFDISDMEISRGGKSFTFDTLSILKKRYPDGELFLFMGSDMFLTLKTWHRSDELIKMCTVCAVSRDNEKTFEEMKKYKNSLPEECKVQLFDIKPFDVSSTEIRERVRSGLDISNLVSPSVAKYIKDNNLYG